MTPCRPCGDIPRSGSVASRKGRSGVGLVAMRRSVRILPRGPHGFSNQSISASACYAHCHWKISSDGATQAAPREPCFTSVLRSIMEELEGRNCDFQRLRFVRNMNARNTRIQHSRTGMVLSGAAYHGILLISVWGVQ